MAESELFNVDSNPTARCASTLPDSTHWNERQVAIAARLAGGEIVRRKDPEAEFGVSDKTLKRGLAIMKAKGLAVPQGNGSDHVWMAGPALRAKGRVSILSDTLIEATFFLAADAATGRDPVSLHYAKNRVIISPLGALSVVACL